MNRFKREVMHNVVVVVVGIVVYGKSSLITIMFRWLCIDEYSFKNIVSTAFFLSFSHLIIRKRKGIEALETIVVDGVVSAGIVVVVRILKNLCA